MARSLLIATNNGGKVREFAVLLNGFGFDVARVADRLGAPLEVEETGATFEENALIKARAAAAATGELVLADDSGLEVDALEGLPGVRSARYAGVGASDADNVSKLMATLHGVNARTARFCCVLALVDPRRSESPLLAHGVCEGAIALEARGRGGFGYDPVFLVAGRGATMAELDPAEKNRVSHRAAAVAALRAQLPAWLASSSGDAV